MISIKFTIKSGFLILGLMAILINGCTFLPAESEPDTNSLVQTYAAQTVEVFSTQEVFESLVAQLTNVSATQTSQPATTTPQNSNTPQIPTNTPPPSATPIIATATPTQPPLPCNWVKFVADVTIQDNSVIGPNADFLKIWRLKNIGRCTWTREYGLTFSHGNQMGGKDVVYLSERVEPGETADLGVWLNSPNAAGSFTGYWQLQDENGNTFGIGGDADGVFWVKIKVEEEIDIPDDSPYVLAHNYCDAEWRTTTGELPCPSGINDFKNGSIYRSLSPVFEGGYKDNEATLVTIPSDGIGGMISGHFPDLEVKEDMQFRAIIGCLDKSPECDVLFQLNYEDEEGDVHNLGSWEQEYDGEWQEITVDLDDLEGEDIEFILTVHNNGDSEDDRAFWLLPGLIK